MAKRYGAARVGIAGGALLAMLAGVDYFRAESSAGFEGEQVQAGTAMGTPVSGTAAVEPSARTNTEVRTAPRPTAVPTARARSSRGS